MQTSKHFLFSFCLLILLANNTFAAANTTTSVQAPKAKHAHHHKSSPPLSSSVPAVQTSSGLAAAYPPLGPMQVTATDSSQFGFVMGWHWVNDVTPNSAFGLQVNFGGNEFLLGGTWAYGINPQNRFKITGEHLAQDFTFTYAAGRQEQWSGQNAGGVAYEHLFDTGNRLRSWLISGYYANAESEYVATQSFTTPQGTTAIDDQAFAGATFGGGAVGVTLQPGSLTRLQLLGNYDDLRGNTQFSPHKSEQGVGATLNLQQLINGHFKLEGYIAQRQIYAQYAATAAYLFHTCPNKHVELNFTASHFSGNLFTTSDNRVMLGCNFSWGGTNDAPAPSYFNDDPDSLRSWTTQAAVAMPEVLVQQDEYVHAP